ncbi:MAG TPA: tetratricopeptide repeat protein, partial [Myxococcota bacterium]|nr:tetratricopeptide repeat protein [Myxococcota bacterium]
AAAARAAAGLALAAALGGRTVPAWGGGDPAAPPPDSSPWEEAAWPGSPFYRALMVEADEALAEGVGEDRRGRRDRAIGAYARAHALYEEASEAWPERPEPFVRGAAARMGLGAWGAALEDLHAAAARAGAAPAGAIDLFALWERSGACALHDGRLAESEEAYGRAAARAPDDEWLARARTGRAMARMAAGDAAGAVADFRAALWADPHAQVAALGLVVALDRAGDVDGARAALRAALALGPGFTPVFAWDDWPSDAEKTYWRGVAAEALGELDDALENMAVYAAGLPEDAPYRRVAEVHLDAMRRVSRLRATAVVEVGTPKPMPAAPGVKPAGAAAADSGRLAAALRSAAWRAKLRRCYGSALLAGAAERLTVTVTFGAAGNPIASSPRASELAVCVLRALDDGLRGLREATHDRLALAEVEITLHAAK